MAVGINGDLRPGFMYNGRMSTGSGPLWALLAYTLLSIGLVAMKKGIGWIGHRGPRDGTFRRSLLTWLAGFAATNLFIVPNALALNRLAPHAVSAMAGWGVIVLVFLSRAWLRESLFPSDRIFAGLIVAAIAGLHLLEPGRGGSPPAAGRLAAAAVLPIILLIPGLTRRPARRTRALLFAAVSGLAGGLIVVSMEGLVSRFEFRLIEWAASPLFYLYLACSLGAFLALQGAYKMGTMMRVGPAQYAGNILYPAICSWWVFGHRLHPLQWAALMTITLGAAGILRRH